MASNQQYIGDQNNSATDVVVSQIHQQKEPGPGKARFMSYNINKILHSTREECM